MKNKTFSFAGLTLRFECAEKIADSDFFPTFYSEKQPDYNIEVVPSALPEKNGKEEYKVERASLYSLENGTYRLYSSYFSNVVNGQYDYACFERCGKKCTLYVDDATGLRDSMLINAVGLPGLLLEKNAGILHSSFVIYKGEAVLFIGKSGIGKSTQAKLWEKHRGALTVNGDRSIISAENGELTAYGLPFCGSSEISLNVSAPVRAIVILSQGKENIVDTPDTISAFNEVRSCLTYEPRNSFESRKAFDLAAQAVKSGRVYSFVCTPDETAVGILEEHLWK